MTLEVILRGEGVLPAVTCSHSAGILDFGHVLEKQSASQVLKVRPHVGRQPTRWMIDVHRSVKRG